MVELFHGSPFFMRLTFYRYFYQLNTFHHKNFSGPPFRPQKFQGPLFDMRIMGQPHGKSYKLNFPWKIWGHFFQGPPLARGSKLLRAPPFCIRPPASVCQPTVSNMLILNSCPFMLAYCFETAEGTLLINCGQISFWRWKTSRVGRS